MLSIFGVTLVLYFVKILSGSKKLQYIIPQIIQIERDYSISYNETNFQQFYSYYTQ
jgi:hypothetical protein